MFAIYGDATRGMKCDIIRLGEKKYSTCIRFDVNGKKYIIERNGILTTKKIKGQTLPRLKESLILKENNKNISCATRIKTNKLIEEKICKFNELLLTSIILQKDTLSFIHLPDRQKRELLCKFVGLEIFDSILNSIKTKETLTSSSILGLNVFPPLRISPT